MAKDISEFREDLDDSSITGINESEGKLVFDLQLWNEDIAELVFEGVVSHSKPLKDKIDFIYQNKEDASLEEGSSIYSLTNNDDEVICNIVARSVDFVVKN